MVGSTSPRSFSHSLPVADPGAAAAAAIAAGGNLKAAIAMHVDARALTPRRNGWTSRAARARSVTLTAAGDDTSNSGNSTDGPSPVPSTAAVMRAPASVPVLAITCSAVGGVVALAIIFALVYVRRIKRRVKSMKRRTNVLGPGEPRVLASMIRNCFAWLNCYILLQNLHRCRQASCPS